MNIDSDEGYFLKIDVQYQEKLQELHNDLNFLPEKVNFEKPTCMTKKTMLCT